MPQGRGKIEKFFRIVRSQLLPGFKCDTLETSMRPWGAGLGMSTTSASIWAPDKPPCSASPARWSASGQPTPTWENTSEKGSRAAWP
ncbi:hypothetical protein DFAR_1100019 [Desulfarculales bacterium]